MSIEYIMQLKVYEFDKVPKTIVLSTDLDSPLETETLFMQNTSI